MLVIAYHWHWRCLSAPLRHQRGWYDHTAHAMPERIGYMGGCLIPRQIVGPSSSELPILIGGRSLAFQKEDVCWQSFCSLSSCHRWSNETCRFLNQYKKLHDFFCQGWQWNKWKHHEQWCLCHTSTLQNTPITCLQPPSVCLSMLFHAASLLMPMAWCALKAEIKTMFGLTFCSPRRLLGLLPLAVLPSHLLATW